MRILVISGTGFLGTAVVSMLSQRHSVAVFHRGIGCHGDLRVLHIHGDRKEIRSFALPFRQFAPDVVLDMDSKNDVDAQQVIDAVPAKTYRIVGISSGSVYRSFGIMMGSECGEIDLHPCDEEHPVRSALYPYRGRRQRGENDARSWLNNYDKILVERTLLGAPGIGASIVRLPLIYGPNDPDGRVNRYVRQMRGGDGSVVLCKSAFGWRNSRASLMNAALAVCLVVEKGQPGRIYNVAEQDDFAEADWIAGLGAQIGWHGAITPVADDCFSGMPVDDLPLGVIFAQHLRMDSSRIRRELGYKEVLAVEEGWRAAVGL